jgi:hypothetical protein
VINSVAVQVPGWEDDHDLTLSNYSLHKNPSYQRKLLDLSLIKSTALPTRTLNIFNVQSTVTLFLRIWQEMT